MDAPMSANDPTLVSQGAAGLQNPPQAQTTPPSEQQSNQLSAATEARLCTYFGGAQLNQADLSFDYQSFGRGNEALTGAVQQGPDARGQTKVIAAVNSDAIANQAPLYGLSPGSIDSNGRATPNSLLDAVAAQEVAQKITQSNPALQGMPREKQELVGEGAMLAVMPDSFTRTLSRASQNTVNPNADPGYSAITQQTTDTLQRTLDAAGHKNLNAGTLLREYDNFEQSNLQRFSGLPNASDARAPYDAAFEEFFRGKGVQNPAQFMQNLQNNMSQDFQQAGRTAIADQIAQNQPQKRSDLPEQDPQFARLFDQARHGLQTIGSERLGVNGQAAIDNTAGVMANDGMRRNFDQFATITQGGNGAVFGMKQDPNSHPGPYDYVAVNPKLAAEVPLAQSLNSAQEHLAQNQQIARTQEPRGMSMG
jgi:hypothetical protein